MKTFLLFAPAVARALGGDGRPGGRTDTSPGHGKASSRPRPARRIDIHFVIKAAPGGGYSAVVTSPDDGAIKNVPATSVKFADSKLTIDVPALSGGYAGTLRKGVLEGEWSQEGAKLPLSLRPYETPTLTKADIDVLRGEWVGKLTAAAAPLTIVLRFTTGADGALRAAFDVPEQGVKDWEAKDVALDDGHFSVELPRPQARVKGMLKGDQIVGQWTQLGMTAQLTLKKDAAPIAQDLTAEAAAPYLGLYWAEPLQRPMIVVLYKDRLALELPWRSLRELKKTDRGARVVVCGEPGKPGEVSPRWRRASDGDGIAAGRDRDAAAVRAGKRFAQSRRIVRASTRPAAREKLAALGTIRMSGGIELTTSQAKGIVRTSVSGRRPLSPEAQPERRRGPTSRGWRPGLDAAPAFVAGSGTARGHGQSRPGSAAGCSRPATGAANSSRRAS